jgi:hypothetical protein
LILRSLREGFWRVVCSNNSAEASGQNWSVTLATPITESPLQVIEKRKLKSVPKLAGAGHFCDGQAFGRNRKLLGNRLAYSASAGKTSVAEVASK